MKGIKFGLALMALIMMVGAAMAQSFDPNYFDQDFTFPADATPSETIPNSAADHDEFPTLDENTIPDDDDFFPDGFTPLRGGSPPSPPPPKPDPSPSPQTSISPHPRVPPRFGPTRHSPCVRKCRGSCTSDRVMFRKACFEACPRKCGRHYRPREHGPKALKKCVLGCISAIPTPDAYTPAFVLEDNLKDQLKACYKTCSARIKINF